MSIGSIGSTVEQQNPYSEQVKKARNEEAEGTVDGTAKTEPEESVASAENQDEYIPSDGDQERASGVYRMEKDENGNSKVTVDAPSSEKSSSSTTNTDSVDAEIKKLKQQRAQLQKQLQNAQGDENQRKSIEKQLAQVEAEIAFKNSDAYRKQQSTCTA
ncbi:hypothetical protein L2W58_11455 [Dethiosulfovibrio sp. F2B]|uniref:hypothetical protein n=1 Tax=Dethiosulfovibrio faecalis TaxID=2720018 RepID=UPI001F1ED304|nr:hypothetical protein [Dethiosulfovibrio faecalis]MCF4152412.1 hypothetical protein [Dethiosulfovibrio faecalis]